jgi:hypothetical protein
MNDQPIQFFDVPGALEQAFLALWPLNPAARRLWIGRSAPQAPGVLVRKVPEVE